jgi:hypothetical protein
MSVLAVAERRRAHRIRVVHGGTGRPYPEVRATLAEPAWPHWHLAVKGADVVLSADTARLVDEPATTTVEVTLTDLTVLERFTAPSFSTTVSRGGDLDATLTLTPRPSVLEVVLVKTDGSERTGRTVTARPKGNGAPAIPLPGVTSGSNIYRSAPHVWDPALAPYVIDVNTNRRGSVVPDHNRAVTRIRLIDP